MNNIELTEDQKKQIEREFKKNPDLKNITQAVFGDEDLDGRSKEGRAELTFTTTLAEKVEEVNLSSEKKQFLLSDNVERGMNALEITRLAFKDREIQPLSQPHRAIMEFLRRYRPEIVDDNDMLTNDKWSPPKSLSRAIKKVNDWAGQRLEEIGIQTKQKRILNSRG